MRLWLALLLVLLCASAASAAATYDAVGSGNDSVDTPLTYSITLSGGTDQGVAVAVFFGTGGDPTGLTVSVGATSLSLVSGTHIVDAGSGLRGDLFCAAVGTTSGAQTVTVSWDTIGIPVPIVSGAISATGVDQGTPCNNGTSRTDSSGNPDAISVTSISGDLTTTAIAAVAADFPTSDRSRRWAFDGTTGALVAAGGDTGTGAGSLSHTWDEVNFGWPASLQIGANFAAASGGGGGGSGQRNLMLRGVGGG